jgi:hypothetical protein
MASNLDRDLPPTAQRAPHSHARRPQAQHPQAPRPQAQQPQASHPLGLDPGSWPVIRQSAARLSRDQDAFIRQLHDDITSMIPDLAGAQGVNMWAFCERMVHSLLWVALTDQPLGVVADMLRQIGAQNWVEGFPDSHYVNVAHALVQTVHYLSEDDWSPSMGSVWISYFMWMRPHLLAGGQQVAAQRASARQAAEREAARVRSPLEDEPGEDSGFGRLTPAPVAAAQFS